MGAEAIWVPLVAAALPAIIGGIGSMVAGDKASAGNAAVDKAGADKLFNMQKGAQAYGAYRPQLMEAQQKALANQMAQYKPAENMLQSMYGGGSTPGTPGGKGGYEPPLPPGWMNVQQPDGTYKPTPGGPTSPLVDPYKQAGFNDKAAYDQWRAWADQQAQHKTDVITHDPGGDPNSGGSPPIFVPQPNMPGGTGAGSSGTSLVGGGSMGPPSGQSSDQMAPLIKAMLGRS